MGAYLENDAVISECGLYRYLLRRTWDAKKPRALLVMLNPSTADARIDDATIRSCVRLLTALQYGSMEVVNLFGFRATDPKELLTCIDPVGPKNDGIVESAVGRCDVVVCAWGGFPAADHRPDIFPLIKQHRPAVYCFGKTKNGSPKHPLYLKTGTPLETYP